MTDGIASAPDGDFSVWKHARHRIIEACDDGAGCLFDYPAGGSQYEYCGRVKAIVRYGGPDG